MEDISDGFFDDYPDVDRRSCKLLGPTALITQALMGVLVISSLIYKRHRESPKRPWRIWLFDVSKQVIGQMFVHGVNVLISGIVAHLSSGNACVLYFLNILIDTTIGVGVIYFFLHLLTWFFSEKCHFKGFESGQYGSPPSFNYWARQATVYVFSLMIMKLLVVALFAAWPGIFQLADSMLGFLGSSDALQVIFTMGIFPIMMNIIQFWLIDSIVKSSQSASLALPTDTPRSSMDPDAEPLFRASSDDDDDDDDRTLTRHDIENPSLRSRSPRDADLHVPGEAKSLSSGASTIVGSGSTTPKPKPVDISGAAAATHAYPPSLASASPSSSLASSVLSSVSVHSHAKSASTSPRLPRRRRSRPLSLSLPTGAPLPRAIAVHTASPSLRVVRMESPVGLGEVHDEKAWAAWEEAEGDDWAERVGEEEWTGRRFAATKTAVDDVWARHVSAPSEVS